MRNKRLEGRVALLKEFIDEWIRFRDFLKSALKDGKVSPEEERKFLEIKSLIARKYQGLVQVFGEEFSSDNRAIETISQAISLESVAGPSGMELREIENSWHQTYIRLNQFLGDLESQGYEVAKISPIGGFFGGLSRVAKGLLRGVGKFILVLVLLFIIYLFGSYFLAEKEARKKGLCSHLVTRLKDVKNLIVGNEEEPEEPGE